MHNPHLQNKAGGWGLIVNQLPGSAATAGCAPTTSINVTPRPWPDHPTRPETPDIPLLTTHYSLLTIPTQLSAKIK
jgi:hypothetical protein